MLRVAVLISGGGTNLQCLIDAVNTGDLNCKISMVISDRPAGGLERAKNASIPYYLLDRKVLKDKLSDSIMALLEDQCDLVVLAGYLSILSHSFIHTWQNRIINIHPALLPHHGGKGMYGLRVHRAVLEAGDKESGCTVHYVTEEIDQGEVILQKKVPVLETDSPEILQERVLTLEHQALGEAINLIASHQ
ncbi:MAG: phosphoribosylglycinamide formyltransferase [Spirochaetaceae bacterium]|jgi:phosphoribosylglycinamide formyltransferase-1|nr:phosphoribosylglycinamide formyltransferase [Spirochaetaceae bacterium]